MNQSHPTPSEPLPKRLVSPTSKQLNSSKWTLRTPIKRVFSLYYFVILIFWYFLFVLQVFSYLRTKKMMFYNVQDFQCVLSCTLFRNPTLLPPSFCKFYYFVFVYSIQITQLLSDFRDGHTVVHCYRMTIHPPPPHQHLSPSLKSKVLFCHSISCRSFTI